MPQTRIALVTDSSCDLPPEYLRAHGIYCLPLHVVYSDGEYRDGVDITPEEVVRRMQQDQVPTTSMPNPGDLDAILEDIRAKGIREVFFCMLSSGLSGTFNMVRLAAQDMDDLDVELYDTLYLSMGLGYYVMTAQDLIDEGRSLHELPGILDANRDRIFGLFSVPDLEYLIKGGRVSKVMGAVGQLLNIKPIISCNEEGKYYQMERVKGFKRALSKMVDIVRARTQDIPFEASFLYSNDRAVAEGLAHQFEALPNLTKVDYSQLGPSLVVHTGPGLAGVCIRMQRAPVKPPSGGLLHTVQEVVPQKLEELKEKLPILGGREGKK